MKARRFRPTILVGLLLTSALALSACAGIPSPVETSAPSAGPESPSASETIEAPSPTETPQANGPEAANGYWCAASETADALYDCFTINVPNVEYDDGSVQSISEHDSPWDHGDGVFEFAQTDAPFGTYYPAGVPIEGLNEDAWGPDPVDKDRIWNSQTDSLALRK